MARLERILFALGLALLAVWGIVKLHRIVISRAQIAKPDAQKVAKAGSRMRGLERLKLRSAHRRSGK
jgi:hypothetical protein